MTKPNNPTLNKAEKAIPSYWYYDINHFQKEIDTVWKNNWIYVCSETQLNKPLSYKTIQIGSQNIVIVRDKNHKLNAFYNTCRHRGSVLCSKNEGQLSKNLLVCPYHQWSYSASDGSLKAITSLSSPDLFDKSEYGLYTVQLKTWKGFIFINLNTDATWSEKNLFQDYAEITDSFPINEMVVSHVWRKEIDCNWKIYWENFSECLHCPNIHPELSDLVPLYSRRLNNIKDDPDWEEKLAINHPKYQGNLREGSQTWSSDGKAQGYDIIKSSEQSNKFQGQEYSTTWPSMFLGFYRDHIRTVRILPINNKKIELVAEWCFTPEALTDKNYSTENVTEFAKLVMTQDADACVLNQQGLCNKVFTEGVLMPEEYTIKDFYAWLRTALNA